MDVCSLATAALLILACLLGAGTALAQEGDEPWQPQAPEGRPTDFDWIRLPSDEWLKGEIISMYDGVLEFDSDELGKLTLTSPISRRSGRRGWSRSASRSANLQSAGCTWTATPSRPPAMRARFSSTGRRS
jgi:hypothetical protein